MNRSSSRRAEIRFSLAVFTALLFLIVGLCAFTARSGPSTHSSADIANTPVVDTQVQRVKIGNVISAIVNFQNLASEGQLTKVIPNSAPCVLTATDNGYRLEQADGAHVDVSSGSFWSSVG